MNKDFRRIFMFPDFGNPRENFDAASVYDLLQALGPRKLHPELHLVAYQDGFNFYSDLIQGYENQITTIQSSLGIQQSFDRGNYARKLLNQEFLE